VFVLYRVLYKKDYVNLGTRVLIMLHLQTRASGLFRLLELFLGRRLPVCAFFRIFDFFLEKKNGG